MAGTTAVADLSTHNKYVRIPRAVRELLGHRVHRHQDEQIIFISVFTHIYWYVIYFVKTARSSSCDHSQGQCGQQSTM